MTAIAQPIKSSPFSVFRNRAFSLLWTGQLISTTGSALTSLASGILVYRLTGSALSVGLMLMVTAIPTLLVGLIAGVFVDRFNRKTIMIVADLVRATLVFMIPFLIPHGIIWLYVIVLLSSSVGQFFDPAHESVIPEIASEQELASADSLLAISSFGSTAIGFAASGLIASRFPIEWAFYLDAFSFVMSALFIFLIKIKPLMVEGETNVSTVIHNLGSGMQYLFKTPILRSLISVGFLVNLSFGLSNVLLLPFALKALHATEFEYGLQEGITSIGFVIGSLLMARFADNLREGQWLVLSYLGMGLASLAYAQSHTVPVAILFIAMSGMLNAPSFVAGRLIIQRNTHREMRGRVASARFVTRDVMYLIGMGMAGLADIINVRVLFSIDAILILGCAVLAQFLPGLGQPPAQWRRALALLRASPSAPRLGLGRAATLADFDLLAGMLPSLRSLPVKDRNHLISTSQIVDTPAGTTILRAGDSGNQAYFVLSGQAVAGLAQPDGSFRVLNPLTPGDFFGEIAALTGAKRTANVVADQDMKLMEVPANSLRGLMNQPAFSQLVLSTMSQRLNRVSLADLPRFAGVDQQDLRELREAPVEDKARVGVDILS